MIELFPGEHIICTEGHLIGTVMRRCPCGEVGTDWAEDIFWHISKPVAGVSSTDCPQCGSRWLFVLERSSNGVVIQRRGRICIDGQWRPPLDALDRKHMAHFADGEHALSHDPEEFTDLIAMSDWEDLHG